MLKKFRFPIRFKILITLLMIISIVVAVITFTMANLFHTDKTAYVHDMTSMMATSLAEEAGSLLDSYRERMIVFSRIMAQRDLSRSQKNLLVKRLFEDFHEFVGISFYWKGKELATAYDEISLEVAALTKDDFVAYRDKNPVTEEMVAGDKVVVANSTLSHMLPTMNLALSHPGPDGDGLMTVIATINLKKLTQIAMRSEVYHTSLIDSEQNFLANSNPDEVLSHGRMYWLPENPVFESMSMTTTLEYVQGKENIIGGFAPLNIGGLIMAVELPRSAAYLTARKLLNNLLLVSLGLLIGSAIFSFLWSRLITGPIERLSLAAMGVAKGDFDVNLKATTRDEIGDLAGSFNQMASELESRETALKDTQSALVQSEKMSAFGQLGAGIAHEVKNPLAGILGMAQLSLRKVEKESEIERNLQIIEKETKRCKSIIDNLMKFARQEKVSFEMVSINQVVEETITIVSHQMDLKSVKFQKGLTVDNTDIEGSANQIQQVLMNLMINAQQAMSGNPGKILVRTLRRGENIEIRVTDNGPGMPEEVSSKIFEPFFTTKPTGKGTGLGLSVSYGIIKDHGGELKVKSVEGKGTAFTISLPIYGMLTKEFMAGKRTF